MEDSIYLLEETPVSKDIAYMSIPIMLGIDINMIYDITDVFYIGKIGNIEMFSCIVGLSLLKISRRNK
jgi:Na+-driven multidrug efflux pump